MKKASALFASFLLLGVLLPAGAFAASARPAEAFTVSEYGINAVISADGSLTVDETIHVNFTEQKHGIVRTIADDGTFAVEDVGVDAVPFTVSSDEKGTAVRIGDADTLVDGEQAYRLHYRLVRRGSSDTLSYNMVGAEWDTTVDAVKFTVTLPNAIDDTALSFIPGTAVKYTVDGTVISGNSVRPLTSHEGLSMRLDLPHGYFLPVEDKGSGVQNPAGEVRIDNPGNQAIPNPQDNYHPVSVGGFAGPAVGILIFIGMGVVFGGIILAAVLGSRRGGGSSFQSSDQLHNQFLIDQQNQNINDMNNMSSYNPPVDTGSPPGGSDGGAAGGGGGSSW